MQSNASVALARYTKKENADVAMVVLLPSPNDDGSLLMHRLPCIEDIRDFQFPSLRKDFSSVQQTAISNLVDGMTASRPLLRPNHALLNFYFEVERRATESEEVLLACSSSPCEIRSPILADLVQEVRQAFPLRPVEPKKGRQRKYWSDIAVPGSSASNQGPTMETRYANRSF